MPQHIAEPVRGRGQRDHLGPGLLQALSRPRRLLLRIDHHPARFLKKPGRGRAAEAPVQDHAERRLISKRDAAHVQPRVIAQHGGHAAEDRRARGPQPMRVLARLRAADPAAGAVGQRGAPVQTQRQLEPQPGQAPGHAFDKARIQRAGLGLQQARPRGDAGRDQGGDAPARHARIRIAHGRHHPARAGLDQGGRAGRRAALMRTGFERDINRRRAGLGRAVEGVDLGMRAARDGVPALGQDAPVPGDHATHAGIRRRGIAPAPGQPQGPRHVAVILFAKAQDGSRSGVSRSS